MSAALKLTDEDVDRIADRVVAKLRLVPSSSSPPTVYTTNKRGPHIPGKSRRWMLEHLSSIAGSRKEGRDWVVPVAAYEDWATAEDTRVCKVVPLVQRPRRRGGPSKSIALESKLDDAEIDAEVRRSLAAGGYRPTR